RFTPCPIGFSIYWGERCKPYSGRDTGKQLIAGCKKQRNCPEKSNLYSFVFELLIILFANI
ncbi:hypothetical protein, partial [Aeromonas veronii]|uniref:hypothetical protein n=1 Tax=Aeromonas veronii TaxID=654 RepID=UPI003BA37021